MTVTMEEKVARVTNRMLDLDPDYSDLVVARSASGVRIIYHEAELREESLTVAQHLDAEEMLADEWESYLDLTEMADDVYDDAWLQAQRLVAEAGL